MLDLKHREVAALAIHLLTPVHCPSVVAEGRCDALEYSSCEVIADSIAHIRVKGSYLLDMPDYEAGEEYYDTYDSTYQLVPYYYKDEEYCLNEYRRISGANLKIPGFNGEDWSLYDDHVKPLPSSTNMIISRFNYRLEMLYYYWMANQDM